MPIADPRDIPGLVAWYSADQAATVYANDVEVATWTDLSGSGNHATGTTSGGGAPVRPRMKTVEGAAGGPAVDFTVTSAGGFFTLPNVFAGASAGEIMLSVKSDAGSLNGLWTMGAFSGGDDGNYYPHLGIIYNSFGLPSGNRQAFTPSVALTSWRRLNSWSAPSDWATLIDEVSQATYAGAGSSSFPTAPLLGRSSASGTMVDTFDGQVGCVLIYSRKLTAGERSDLSAWLTANPSGGTTAPAGLTSSLAATVRARSAAFASSTVGATSLAATMRPRAATFASTAVSSSPESVLAATLQAKVAAFTSDAAINATLRGSALAATLQPRVASFLAKAVTPIAPVPAALQTEGPAPVVVGRALGPVTMVNGTQPTYPVSWSAIQRSRQQIVVDGVDVTFFRGVRTPDVTYTLTSPLRYGPGHLDLPQVAACFETPGVGDLAWLREGAPVEVNLVLDDPAAVNPPVMATEGVYKGVVVAFDLSGRDLSVELGGEVSGRAALRDRQAVIFPRVNDIGHQISDAVKDLGIPVYPALGADTGIEVMTTGGVGHLEHIQNLCAQAWTRQGKYWTVMPNEAGAYVVRQKSDTQIHGTVFFDDARTVARLRRDIAEEPNRIFITGVTPQGQRVRFGVYPGLIQGPAPAFPGLLQNGDTGEGVRLLIGKLHAVGYLKLYEVAGGFDVDVVEAVKNLQEDAGLPKTGNVNLATWEALYDLNVTTTSLEGAHIEPAAQASVVRRWNRSGSGTILEFNDGYDPEVLKVDRTIDAGVGKTRSQLREFARTVLDAASTPNWVGDIVFHTGALLVGEQLAGVTVTPELVKDARTLIPTQNLWAPRFAGGTQFNVSACQVDQAGLVTATVDTRFRDAAEVWEIIDRNRESRNDPARRRQQKHRSSTITKDSIGEWDEIGGRLGHDVTLEPGWNQFEVVAAMEGQIAWLKIVLANPAEFAVAIFGRSGGKSLLNDVNPKPLAAGGAKKWNTHRDALDDRGLLYSAGTPLEPCGYWPGRKKFESTTEPGENPDYAPTADANTTGTDDQEFIDVTTTESFGTITGKHVDDAGFRYWSEDRTKIYVCVYVRNANTIPLGRIMRNQLESGA